MTAFSLLLILVGLFIILNSKNFVEVLKGNADISFLQPSGPASSGVGAGATGTSGAPTSNTGVGVGAGAG